MFRYIFVAVLTFVAISCSNNAIQKNGREILAEITVPSVKLHDVSLEDFAEWVETVARKGDPEGLGFTVKIVRNGVGGLDDQALGSRRVTLDLQNLSLLDVMTLACVETSTRFKVVGREIQLGSDVDY